MKIDSPLKQDFLLLQSTLSLAVALKRYQNNPLPFSHVIIKREEGETVYYYLYPNARLEAAFSAYAMYPDAPLKDVLGLHEYSATRTVYAGNFEKIIDGESEFVVLSRGVPTGYIVPPVEEAESAPEMAEPESSGSRGLDEDDGFESFPTKAEPPSEAPPEPKPFNAFPSISNPGKVERGASFSVDVGFSKELDKTLRSVRGISIASPDPDDFLEVALMPVGAEVADNTLKKLFLDLDAKVTFHCTAHPDATEISLVATYFYKRQPVGTATRIVNDDKPAAGNHSLSIDSQYNSDVDLTAIIRWDKSTEQLRWRLIAADPSLDVEAMIDISDTRAFAASLSNQLDPNNNKGQAAFNILATLGQQIAAHIPPDFFNALKQINQKTNRPPCVLLWTDDPYLPWELAYHRDLALDPSVRPFLHLQTCIGRWWVSDQVVMPLPTTIPVQRLSVVASDYSKNLSLNELPEAGVEKKFLIDHFSAEAVKPDQDSLLALTGEMPPSAGHLLHLALHGISKADLNEQEIILEDGKTLSANALFGPYFPGDTPAISFMFMNACQVGTAGNTLGQASGFPGIMLKKGMLGFIAPLWSVDDVPARNFSENFYNKTLEAGQPIGQVLLELRRGVDYKNSLTELAYIYYGHPSLKLVKSFDHGK